MSGNHSIGREVFSESMKIMNTIGRCCSKANVSADFVEESITKELKVSPEEVMHKQNARIFMTRFLYGNESGIFPPAHMHLRHVNAHMPAIQTQLNKWRDDYGMKVVWSILLNGDIYLDTMRHKERLEYWLSKLGPDRFVTFICDSGACRLLNDQFHERLEYWLSKLGPDRFVTFICGSGACRLLNDQFHERLEYWLSKMGPDRFVTFISDSGAC
jgi:hypothetical protein